MAHLVRHCRHWCTASVPAHVCSETLAGMVRPVLVAVTVAACLGACTGGPPPQPSPSASEATSQQLSVNDAIIAIPTWPSGKGGPLAIFQGRLSGEVHDGKLCAMFTGKDGTAIPVAWPEGSRASGSGDAWKVVDSHGRTVGNAEAAVSLTGGQVPVSIGGASVAAAGCLASKDIIVVTDLTS
jgi:hypothetical protein